MSNQQLCEARFLRLLHGEIEHRLMLNTDPIDDPVELISLVQAATEVALDYLETLNDECREFAAFKRCLIQSDSAQFYAHLALPYRGAAQCDREAFTRLRDHEFGRMTRARGLCMADMNSPDRQREVMIATLEYIVDSHPHWRPLAELYLALVQPAPSPT